MVEYWLVEEGGGDPLAQGLRFGEFGLKGGRPLHMLASYI